MWICIERERGQLLDRGGKENYIFLPSDVCIAALRENIQVYCTYTKAEKGPFFCTCWFGCWR